MPISSGWPLKQGGVRFFVPLFACEQLAQHPLTKHLYVEGLGYYPDAVGHNMSRSSHDDCLIMYCTKGKGSLHVDDTDGLEISVHEGDLMILPKGVAHRYKADRDTPWSMYWAHFNGQSAVEYLNHLIGNSDEYVLSLGIQPKLITDFESLLSVQKTGYQFSRFIYASNLLAQLLTHIAVIAPNVGRHANAQLDLVTIKNLMEENLSRQLDLDTLAESANLSKFHFSKKYKALTGYSPIQHFIHMKMERACYLLDISEQSVSAISDELGYEDAQYFSRLFKKVVGISPRDYRRLDRG